MSSTKVTFTEREWGPGTLRTIRHQLGKTEAEIAKEAGLTEEMVKKYEAKGGDLQTGVKIQTALERLGGKHPNAK